MTFTLRPIHAVAGLVVVAVALGAFFGVRSLLSGGANPKYASTYPKNLTQLLSQGMPTATDAQVKCVGNWLENNVSYGELEGLGQAGLGAYTTALHQGCNIPLSVLLEPSAQPSGSTTSPSTTMVPTAAPPTTTTTPASPTTVVQDYFAAINAHDYQEAWALGGENLGGTYAAFVEGFSDTAEDSLTTINSQGNTVYVAFVATQDSGTKVNYQGTYTVSSGVIVGAHVEQTTPSGAATTTTAAGSFAGVAGTWPAHDMEMVIGANGAGTVTYPDFVADPGACESCAPSNVISFQLYSLQGSTAPGIITGVTDPADVLLNATTGASEGTVGVGSPMSLMFIPASPGRFAQLWAGGQQVARFCDQTAQSTYQCGA